ncbi:MAG TPA: transglycosylase SLT domain-containing protein [Xanthobacteraceae bacterium]|jgi:soluble lytic murein transglycosylase-like protein|nr:transglycosylase SLT domain-containing protein [Xanthobacteraceae bacterium]
MRLSLRALVCTMVISCGALTSLHARELSTNPDRAPRTQGVEPDTQTRRELSAIVDRHAAAANIPADFVRAVIRIESDWDVNLTGHAGEVGLMQIKPSTARAIGYTGSDETLYEPDTNIRWGVKYLAAAYQLAGGDLCRTVLKYQAGHQAIKMTDAANAYCGRVRTIMASLN